MTSPALAPWFGCKRSLAADIVAEIMAAGRPAYFAEPFGGSMAVSLAMPDVQTHVVNDLDGELIHLARTIANPESLGRFAVAMRHSLCSEAIYLDACELVRQARQDPGSVKPEVRAWAFAVSQWLGPNGAPPNNDRFCMRWGPGGGDPAKRLRSATRSLIGAREKLRRFIITNRDAFRVLADVTDDPRSCVYADPPYTRASRGPGDYLFDFEDHGGRGDLFGENKDPDDHERLAEALNRFEHARVVVSYYDDPRLDELYPAPRWRKRVLGSAAGLTNASGSTSRDRVEILLINDRGRG